MPVAQTSTLKSYGGPPLFVSMISGAILCNGRRLMNARTQQKQTYNDKKKHTQTHQYGVPMNVLASWPGFNSIKYDTPKSAFNNTIDCVFFLKKKLLLLQFETQSPSITDFDVALAVEQQIRAFNVAMDNAETVQILQSLFAYANITHTVGGERTAKKNSVFRKHLRAVCQSTLAQSPTLWDLCPMLHCLHASIF